MECATGQVIRVTSATYGRDDNTVCPGPGGPCPASDVSAMVQAECESRNSCYVSPVILGDFDPCYGILKYLQFTYECVNAAGDPVLQSGFGLGCPVRTW